MGFAALLGLAPCKDQRHYHCGTLQYPSRQNFFCRTVILAWDCSIPVQVHIAPVLLLTRWIQRLTLHGTAFDGRLSTMFLPPTTSLFTAINPHIYHKTMPCQSQSPSDFVHGITRFSTKSKILRTTSLKPPRLNDVLPPLQRTIAL
ncbi:hypothetical protein BT69DRAFT_1278114 [Atractiella rhizophila]|nr:hypothetical protein BT69DRAFT_1278114 [Atractiella rhizophila]